MTEYKFNFEKLPKLSKPFGPRLTAKSVFCTKINDEVIIVKTFRRKRHYDKEKRAYTMMKRENFLPKMRYYNDKQLTIGLTDVGMALCTFMKKHRSKFNEHKASFFKQRDDIYARMKTKYGIVHGDEKLKNTCVDEAMVIRVIDFDRCKFSS